MDVVACTLHSLGKAPDNFEMSKIFGELDDYERSMDDPQELDTYIAAHL